MKASGIISVIAAVICMVTGLTSITHIMNTTETAAEELETYTEEQETYTTEAYGTYGTSTVGDLTVYYEITYCDPALLSAEATIKSCSEDAVSVDIPSTISLGNDAGWVSGTQCTVTGIDDSAFEGCTSLESIEIQDGVTTIGDWAFSNCTSLESVVIPDSVTFIGYSAFSGCSSLKSVSLPNSLKQISNSLFFNCISLESIVIPDSVTTIGVSAFNFCTSLESIVIPDSVTTIGGYAFYYCTFLESIEIPDSVTTIGDYAFYYCTSLESIEIPDGVTTIGDKTFYNCTSLESVVIPDSVTTIGDSAFYKCTSLKSADIPDGASYSWSSFSYTDLTLFRTPPEEETYLNFYLSYYPSLNTLYVSNSVTSLYMYDTDYLTALIIPASVQKITYINPYQVYTETPTFDYGSLTDIYYEGNEEDWGSIDWGSYEDEHMETWPTGGPTYYNDTHYLDPLYSNSTLTIHFNSTGPVLTEDDQLYGDVNSDNTVNILDVVTLNKVLIGKYELSDVQSSAADVNLNGTPDASDAVTIMKYVVKLISKLPL